MIRTSERLLEQGRHDRSTVPTSVEDRTTSTQQLELTRAH